jgi:hypothetical protein
MSERLDGRHRAYRNALIRRRDGAVLFHDCSKCHEQFMRGSRGVWLECADRHNELRWVCARCLQQFSAEMAAALNEDEIT